MTIKRYALAVAMTVSSGYGLAEGLPANDHNQQINILEQRIDGLEARLQRDRLGWLDNVNLNGFMTYGVIRHNVHQQLNNGAPITYRNRTTDEISHQELSRVGLQLDARLNERTRMVMQMLARGRDDYDLSAQWAFIDYQLNPSVQLRGGRLRLPFFMHSQYSNVGYAYHWVSLPGEAYDVVPFDTMDGVDVSWSLNTGPIHHRLNVYAASMDVESLALPVPVVYEVRDMYGINLQSSWGDLSTWASYTNPKVTLDLTPVGAPQLSFEETRAYVSSAGFQYDNGRWLLMAERSQLGIHGWFPTKWGGYVSTGYRFGAWMPHITWAAANAKGLRDAREDGPLGEAFFNGNAVRQKSWTLGLRYDPLPNLALKGEVKYLYDFSNKDAPNSNGLFDPKQAVAGGDIERSDPLVFRLSADVAF